MARSIDDMKCPFCGKKDIEYGLALCAGCHADIQYDVVDRNSATASDAQMIERLEKQADKAKRDFDASSWPFNGFAMKRLAKIADEMEVFAKNVIGRANDAVDRRLQRGETTSIVTFTRGDRSLDVQVYVPLDLDAKVDFDVVLVAHNGKKMNVTAAVRKLTNLGMGPSIKLVDKVPTTLLTRVSQHDAEAARRELTAAGATVEVR
ncbi:ribosomal protein L7/L12 [Sphingomonas sp. Leaf38]|uniref:ribosomal protein L7/L12 n=1 Tax=Sphingomonas sp. Leaf38 TaxID=1736217 RepID=UPI000700585B|nr:ribosomal protein L7/L12 [Sphingomonas sp. Leaf38]KQN24712.1 hypothetical protein ASE88_16915 [Sphingomonas sp. Leaf38]